MTETNNELTLIEQELEIAKEIESLRESLSESRKTRRGIPKPSKALEVAQEAYDAAAAKVARLKQEGADAKALKASLNARLDGGDESVSVDEILAAEKAIERAGRLLKPAEQAAKQTQRALQPLLADEHLAYLAADALESISDVPVVVYKTPGEAPEIEPLIVVSQTTPTEAYGTLEANGSVRLRATGAEIDTKALQAALEDAGSEVSVSSNGVVFDTAAWPTPRLSNPSVHALAELMLSIKQGFRAQVYGGSGADRMEQAGYRVSRRSNEWAGLVKRGDERLEVTKPGEAVGTATLFAAIQHDRGESVSAQDVKDELTTLISTFQSEAIGGWSEAGEIVSIELGEMEEYRGDGNPWTEREVVRVLGVTAWPVTVSATLRVTYRYVPAEEV